MERDQVLAALASERAQLFGRLSDLSEKDFERPTRCRPWSVRAVLAHLLVASNRLPAMLDEPPPPEATVTAGGYYRADRRFGKEANEARIAAADADATSFAGGRALAQAVDDACVEMATLAAAEPRQRLVRTRWGDAMALGDFLVTRVVELGVHGLDVADGLGRTPWLTPAAADVIADLVVEDGSVESVPGLGWDRLTLIEAATGRRPVADDERSLLARHGVRWLTFG